MESTTARLTVEDLRIGDVLCSPRGFGLYSHYFAWLGGGWVAELAGDVSKDVATARARISRLEVATGGKQLKLMGRCTAPAEEVFRRLEEVMGTGGYHLVWKNCEHFARYVSTGVARSTQVNAALIISAIGFVTYLLSTDDEQSSGKAKRSA